MISINLYRFNNNQNHNDNKSTVYILLYTFNLK